MKKYVKPELFLEEFELSQSVAACGWDITVNGDNCKENAKGDATLDPSLEGLMLFNKAGEGGCNVGFDNGERYCYEPGAADVLRIYNS